jgi:TPR repeat protein
MYAEGLGIPQDLPQAIRLLEAVARPAASSDAFAARIELGRMFSRSLLADTVSAVKWYSAAVAVAPDEDCEEVREARAYIVANTDGSQLSC